MSGRPRAAAARRDYALGAERAPRLAVVPGMGRALIELPSGLTSSLRRSRGFTRGLFDAIVGCLRDRGLATG